MARSLSIFLCLACVGHLATAVAVPVSASLSLSLGVPGSTSIPTPAPAPGPESASGGYRSMAYFVNWGIFKRNYHAESLPAEQLTHVLYAFADIHPDGDVFLTDVYADLERRYPGDPSSGEVGSTGDNVYGSTKQLFLLKKRNRNLKVMLSIGGWDFSQHFVGPASSESGRKRFAETAVKLMGDMGMDGLDVDWEYPLNDQEGENMLQLLRATRQELDKYAQANAKGEHFLLSVATAAGPTRYKVLDLKAISEVADFINLMAYDYALKEDTTAAHTANINPSLANPLSTPFNTEQAIAAYIDAGVPPSQISLGIPLYGRSFANTDGPGKPLSGVDDTSGRGNGSWDPDVWDVKALPRPGAKVIIERDIGATYSYDSQRRVMISYDTQDTVREKAEYIKRKGLGGAMWWEASGDREVGNGSLIATLVDSLGGTGGLDSRKNFIDYPASRYENLRKQFS
ncbi:glycoside hydrolase family 18 protein [Aspergillus candidus]|uniref:chitinase n=1 Tax=Aspergillus candidus TaxID=41067 RepID=A0A2I2FK71_ASPCN|nr:putative class V chitinase [Aspergillus candidus]PLB41035.1 putative class V chitinase [Aspergillus candidus]